MGYGGDGTQQALRINGTLMIEMIVAKEFEIYLCQDIDIGILGITVSEEEDGTIDD